MRTCIIAVIGFVLAGALGACETQDAFHCANSSQCEDRGTPGICEPTGACSFPSDECPSRRRYGPHAVAELAGRCVEESQPAHDTDAPDAPIPRTIPPEAGGSSGTGEPELGESSTGTACSWEDVLPSCLEQYGAQDGFELCEETPTTCTFAATVLGLGCQGVCASSDGVCLSAQGNGVDACVQSSPSSCGATERGNDICVCSRGC